MDEKKIQGYILYRIYYGNQLVYVGRTKQPLQKRIRGHLFQKPMHRTISIEQVSKIEYAEFKTEADMNLYEIYFILKWHPLLNVDDKTRDFPTVDLPPVEWSVFTTHLWDKWKDEILNQESEKDRLRRRFRQIPEDMRVLRSLRNSGEISYEVWEERYDELKAELDVVRRRLWGQ